MASPLQAPPTPAKSSLLTSSHLQKGPPLDVSADYPDPDLAPLSHSMSTLSVSNRPPLPAPPSAAHNTTNAYHRVSQSYNRPPHEQYASGYPQQGYGHDDQLLRRTSYGAPPPPPPVGEFGGYQHGQQQQLNNGGGYGQFEQIATQHYASQGTSTRATNDVREPFLTSTRAGYNHDQGYDRTSSAPLQYPTNTAYAPPASDYHQPASYDHQPLGHRPPPPPVSATPYGLPPVPPQPPQTPNQWGQPSPAPTQLPRPHSSAGYGTGSHHSQYGSVSSFAPPPTFTPAPTFAPPPEFNQYGAPPVSDLSRSSSMASFAPPPSFSPNAYQQPFTPLPPPPQPPAPPSHYGGSTPLPQPPRPPSSMYGGTPQPPPPPPSLAQYSQHQVPLTEYYNHAAEPQDYQTTPYGGPNGGGGYAYSQQQQQQQQQPPPQAGYGHSLPHPPPPPPTQHQQQQQYYQEAAPRW